MKFECSMLLMFYWDNELISSNLASFSTAHIRQELKELHIILFELLSCNMLGNGILTPYLTHFRELNEKSVLNVMQKVKFYVLFVVLFNPNFGVLLHRTRAVPVLQTSLVLNSFFPPDLLNLVDCYFTLAIDSSQFITGGLQARAYVFPILVW